MHALYLEAIHVTKAEDRDQLAIVNICIILVLFLNRLKK